MLAFFDFRIPQGGAAIYGRWGGNLCGVYIDNFFMNQLVKEYWKSVQICQSHHQTSMGILFWAMHKSLTGQKLTMPAHPTTKACWIGGEVWNRKPVFEKEPCWHTIAVSYHSEACPVRDYNAPFVPRQEEVSGAATDWRRDSWKSFSV